MPRTAALALLLLAAAPAAAQPPARLDFDHTDLAVEYVGGAWRGQLRNQAEGTAYAPDQAVLVVNPSSVTPRPGGANFDFLGAPAGSPVWILDQNQNPDQLYLGVSSEQMRPTTDYANWNRPGTAQTRLFNALQVTGVRAPAGGEFAVWQNVTAGQDVFVSTADRGATNDRAGAGNNFTPSPNTIYGLIGSHAHYNWAFTQPGRYEIDLVPLAYTTDALGALTPLTLPVDAPPVTFVFDVVPVPEPAIVLAVAAAGLAVARGRRLVARR